MMLSIKILAAMLVCYFAVMLGWRVYWHFAFKAARRARAKYQLEVTKQKESQGSENHN